MGDVHRARVEATGEEVALKVMRAASTFDDEAATRERFVREARVLAGLSHPCIVRYVAHGTTLDGQPFVAAEWVEGETLADRISRKRITPRDAAALGASLADALATSHEAGVAHRDLKPTNVMIAKDGRPKLIDFGVAKSAAPALTLDGAIVGSHGYMSPEQLRGGFAVGPAADAYGLGCVLFRALAGRTPFEGVSEGERLARMLLEDAPDVREARPDVPEELALLVASMLRPEAEERPTMRALATELARIARVMESVAPPAMHEDALSRKEQSIVSVVYVAATSPDAPTNAIDSDGGALDDVRAVLAERGARIEKLPNGALAAVFGPRAAL
ncbi:MAG TPA: serine/threonine-protein kinase, partial [Labilithrix sp.]